MLIKANENLGQRRDTEYRPYLVRMRENAERMWTRTTPNTDTFYAVFVFMLY